MNYYVSYNDGTKTYVEAFEAEGPNEALAEAFGKLLRSNVVTADKAREGISLRIQGPGDEMPRSMTLKLAGILCLCGKCGEPSLAAKDLN